MTTRRALRAALRAAAIPCLLLTTPAAATAATVTTPLTIQHSIATPITKASPCTVEPKAALYGNEAYDPAKRTAWFGGENLPSTSDITADTRAGANADVCLGFGFQPDLNVANHGFGYPVPADATKDTTTNAVTGDDMRDIVIDLPEGYAGNLTNIQACSDANFGVDGIIAQAATPANAGNGPVRCADNTLVGDAVVRMTVNFLGVHTPVGGVDREPPDGGHYGAIFKLNATANELGRLGVQIYPAGLGGVRPAKFTIRLRLAPDGSGRVQAVVENAPRAAVVGGTRDLFVEAVWMRMWGAKADHPQDDYQDDYGIDMQRGGLAGDFMETATSCDAPLSAHVKVTTYGGARAAAPATYAPTTTQTDTPGVQLTDCAALPFSPSVTVATTARTPGAPTGVTVKLGLAQTRAGERLPSLLRDAAVTLPQGLELGAQAASGASGLTFCSPAQFSVATPLTANACPAATKAGTVQITSPLIALPFVGDVFLGAPSDGQTLPDLYLEAALQGSTAPDAPRIKLVGKTTVDEAGRITATFKKAPQLRFSELALTFPGGPNALFSTPQRCGTTTGRSLITPTSTGAAVPVDASLTIDQGCGAPFAPSVSVVPADPQAGRKAATKIVISREPASPWISRVAVRLPGGLLADLNSATECGAGAATGACPVASRIGTLHVRAGAGDQPLPLEGALYLTGRQPGDVAGAVLVTRAKIGDLDLGDVVVPGRIALRPTDAGLTFTADVPLRHKGLALQLQRIEVDLDRENFALNPTACGPLPFSADITSDGPETATPNGSVSYTGCGNLPFAPKLRATLTGDNTPGGHPGMYVELTSPDGDSAMRAADVTLPKGVAAALPNVQNPCAREQFDAGACPASTRVGSATAQVSITPEAITGDVFLVRVPGKALPGLGLNFTGRYAQRVLSSVQVNREGRLVTSFAEIPDLPLRRLVIDVASGPRSPLQLPQGSCANGSGWTGTFIAQGGQTAKADTGLQCAAPAQVRLDDKRGFSVRLFDLGSRTLQSVKATLPKGWRFTPKAAKRRSTTWARMTGGRATLRVTKASVTATRRKGAAPDVRIKVAGAAVRPATRAARKAKTGVVGIRLAFTDGTVQTQTVTVRLR